jgi:hypothetical protein
MKGRVSGYDRRHLKRKRKKRERKKRISGKIEK